MGVEAPIILFVIALASRSVPIAVGEAIYPTIVGDPPQGNGNNNRVDITNSRIIRGSITNKAIKAPMDRATTPTMATICQPTPIQS